MILTSSMYDAWYAITAAQSPQYRGFATSNHVVNFVNWRSRTEGECLPEFFP